MRKLDKVWLVVLLGGRVSPCDRLYHRDTSTVQHPEMTNEQAHLHAADMCSCFSHAVKQRLLGESQAFSVTSFQGDLTVESMNSVSLEPK